MLSEEQQAIVNAPLGTMVILKFHDKHGNAWSAGAAMTKLRRGDEEFPLTEQNGYERGIQLQQITVVDMEGTDVGR